MKQIALFILILLTCASVKADIKLPALVGNGMVLQRDKPITIWGKANANEKLAISFANKRYTTVANSKGLWRLKLPSMKAGGPYTMRLQGNNLIVLNDILIGDVWVCSGDSDMDFPLSMAEEAEEEIKKAVFPNIRLFTVEKKKSLKPADDTKGSWSACTPELVKNFSAIAYFFGRDIHKKLGIPVGLIHSGWGGTATESWISGQEITGVSSSEPAAQNSEALFNSMITPLTSFSLKGMIWYQGDTNTSSASQYRDLFPRMINNFRLKLNQGQFPFLFVQFGPHHEKFASAARSYSAELREAQSMAMKVRNTWMATAIDLVDTGNINLATKQEMARRLALVAKREVYHLPAFAYGPTFASYKVNGKEILIRFNNTANGLTTKDKNTPGSFQIAGGDKKFYWATAEIVDDHTVRVFSDKVPNPAAVRYAWEDNPLDANLTNSVGLPAFPFRTDSWYGISAGNK